MVSKHHAFSFNLQGKAYFKNNPSVNKQNIIINTGATGGTKQRNKI